MCSTEVKYPFMDICAPASLPLSKANRGALCTISVLWKLRSSEVENSSQSKHIVPISPGLFTHEGCFPTLKTNISLLRMARVLNPPSQMLGLALGWDGLSPGGSLGGRVCLSGLRGSEGGWERGGGTVGKGLVGWGSLSGGPKTRR